MNLPKVNNLRLALRAAQPDPVVGVSLVHMAGDASQSMYAASIPAGGVLKAHYHQQGDEFYQVIEGNGSMLLQAPQACVQKLQIKTGDVFVVPAMMSHQLLNKGPEPLVMVFSCPQSHIGHDRHLQDDLIEEVEG